MNATILAVVLNLLGGAAPESLETIHRIVSRAPEDGGVHGAVLVAHCGEIVYREALGMADRDLATENQLHTKFLIGSLTKSFTAALILQLVEEETLSLNQNICDLLPWYREDSGTQVTLHHLLSHTSGVPNYLANVKYFTTGSQSPLERRTFVETYCSEDLEFTPGEQFAYSPSGYVILGEIIEAATGKMLHEVFRERIADKLELHSTDFAQSLDGVPDLAKGYGHSDRGFRPTRPFEVSTAGGSGAMFSTVDDLFRWYTALESGEVISNESYQRMLTPNLDNYAYGWFVTTKTIAERNVALHSHGGRINGFNSAIVRVPDIELCIIILTNVEQRSAMGTAIELVEAIAPGMAAAHE